MLLFAYKAIFKKIIFINHDKNTLMNLPLVKLILLTNENGRTEYTFKK